MCERYIDQFPLALNWASGAQPRHVSDWESNCRPLGSQTGALYTEPHQQGHRAFSSCQKDLCLFLFSDLPIRSNHYSDFFHTFVSLEIHKHGLIHFFSAICVLGIAIYHNKNKRAALS